MAHKLFPKLLEPITINGHKLRNRVLMGSMHTGLEDSAFFTPNLEPLGRFLARRYVAKHRHIGNIPLFFVAFTFFLYSVLSCYLVYLTEQKEALASL